MDQSLTNLFAKYQNNLAFSSHPRITSVHDVGTMDETLLNLAVINQAREDVLLDLLRKYSSHRINQSCNQIYP